MTDPATSSAAPPVESAGLKPFQRLVAIFAKPAEAWSGLESRAQWWIPLLIFLVVMASGMILVYQRAIVPSIAETFDRQVAEGQMSAEQADGMIRSMSGPLGMLFVILPQSLTIAAVFFLSALAISFSVGFLMGGKLRYRLALEVSAWSALVSLPGQILFFVLAWFRESMEGVHIGFGAFVPEPETPSKLMRGLALFLDFLGPFSIWSLVVSILGAAALSGLPRKSVAWTLVTVNVVLWICFAGLSALFSPGT